MEPSGIEKLEKARMRLARAHEETRLLCELLQVLEPTENIGAAEGAGANAAPPISLQVSHLTAHWDPWLSE